MTDVGGQTGGHGGWGQGLGGGAPDGVLFDVEHSTTLAPLTLLLRTLFEYNHVVRSQLCMASCASVMARHLLVDSGTVLGSRLFPQEMKVDHEHVWKRIGD